MQIIWRENSLKYTIIQQFAYIGQMVENKNGLVLTIG